MPESVEFELRIGGGEGAYAIDVRITQPGSDAPIQPLAGESRPFALELASLDAQADADVEYGNTLAAALFADRDVRSAFERALTMASSLDTSLRVRLDIAPEAARFHQVRWELLTLPGGGTPLLTRDDVLFSRFVSSSDFRRVPLRPRSELRALIVASAADPSTRWPDLEAIVVDREVAAAEAALGPIAAELIGSAAPVTLSAIVSALRRGFDILYLVCHGGRGQDGEPFLLLEDDQRRAAIVRGGDLVTQISELAQPPRLIVLASCQSAGPDGVSRTKDEGALAALGPQLADSGIGAVIAMQGQVGIDTVAAFMAVFFREMARDGVIDRAMAAARSVVRTRPDWWMPTLFMRLRSGRMWWYQAGFREEFNRWPGLMTAIANGRCTPILGPGLTDHIVGSRREVAQRLAEAHDFPMARHAREDLPQVAQFLKIRQGAEAVPSLVLQHLCREVVQRYRRHIPPEMMPSRLEQLGQHELADLYERLLEKAWRHRAATEPNEPHSVLASLPFPLYVTTNSEQLLHKAVADAVHDVTRKAPCSEIARWKSELSGFTSLFDPPDAAAGTGAPASEYKLDRVRPLIYQLFGTWTAPESLVMTEDDYFDFLIGVTANKDLIPKPVRRALADSALLFLGFHLDDWDFRVLFRSLASQEGGGRRRAYAHVAVQIDPDEGRVLRPEQARQFLSEWFHQAEVSIFWGTVQDFVKELERHWTAPENAAALLFR